MLRALVVVAVITTMKIVNVRDGDLVMPDPLDVVSAGRQLFGDGTMLRALRESLYVLGVGFVLASVVGIVVGVLFGGLPLLGRVAEPFIHALSSTPRVAFIPLIIVWLGLREEAKIAVIWLSAVIPIMINTISGIEAADSDLTEMARSFGARRHQLFWRVWIPGAVPSILTGLRIGASLAILGTVVAELYTAQAGLGGLLVRSSSRFRMDDYFAVVIVLMGVGVSITSLLRMLERRFLVWRTSIADGGGP